MKIGMQQRREQEIAARVRKLGGARGKDPNGYRREILVPRLPWALAKEFVPAGAFTAETWAGRPQAFMSVRDEAGAYVLAGLRAALAHDGVAAMRNVVNLGECAWLSHGDKARSRWRVLPWKQFGVPTFRWAAELYGMESPISEIKGLRLMADGRPCAPGCDRGCKS